MCVALLICSADFERAAGFRFLYWIIALFCLSVSKRYSALLLLWGLAFLFLPQILSLIRVQVDSIFRLGHVTRNQPPA